MKHVLVGAIVALVVLGPAGVPRDPGVGLALAQPRGDLQPSAEEPVNETGLEFPVPPKPLPKTITPCRACHGPEQDFPLNVQRREGLLVHGNIKLNHGGVRVWCLDCHHPDDRNYLLPLSDGLPIEFEKSHLLCGKCHGTKFRDWRYGIHGRRTGSWNAAKSYHLCVHCHDPHSPRFKPIEPMPPPKKPHTPTETRARH